MFHFPQAEHSLNGGRSSILLLTLILVFAAAPLPGQTLIGFSGAWLQSSHELTRWFDSGSAFELQLGMRDRDAWDKYISIGQDRFTAERGIETSFSQSLDLDLTVTRIWFSGAYRFRETAGVTPLINLSGGPLHWEGRRGEVIEDSSVGLPAMGELTLAEWNMGFRAGAGLRWELRPSLETDFYLHYSFIPGSLWPSMQEYVELESVNSFQYLSAGIVIRGLFAKASL